MAGGGDELACCVAKACPALMAGGRGGSALVERFCGVRMVVLTVAVLVLAVLDP